MINGLSKMKKRLFLLICLILGGIKYGHSQVWSPDQGDGTYCNPIIHADYSDPDVIRVGDDYYMVASSFTCFPGIPVLHSKDLVNWRIINHVYCELPFDRYKYPAHGQGSWAPAIRYHDGLYYVYFCTPEEGLFVAYTRDPRKRWTLKNVLKVSQWEDPCPFWDDDGNAYLVRSKLCGGPVYLHRMSPDGLEILDNGKIVYWDDSQNPVLEGLKMMKRNGWYYIVAPAGGVTYGWQTVLRSKNIEGPYETKKVLDAGNGINGPHQGGLVETQTGEWWFIHFQDKGMYGRVVHLQPAQWVDDWVVMGEDPQQSGCGKPVLRHRKPNVGRSYAPDQPQTSDEFDAKTLGLQWQWQAIEQHKWYSLSQSKGSLRLFAVSVPSEDGNLYYAGNLLLQKFPAPEFTAKAKVDVSALRPGERGGLIVMGNYHSYICVVNEAGNKVVAVYEGKYENCGYPPRQEAKVNCAADQLWLKVEVFDDATCRYAYSWDNEHYTIFDHRFRIERGQWIGAKVGLFCINPDVRDGKGYMDVDYFHIE